MECHTQDQLLVIDKTIAKILRWLIAATTISKWRPILRAIHVCGEGEGFSPGTTITTDGYTLHISAPTPLDERQHSLQPGNWRAEFPVSSRRHINLFHRAVEGAEDKPFPPNAHEIPPCLNLKQLKMHLKAYVTVSPRLLENALHEMDGPAMLRIYEYDDDPAFAALPHLSPGHAPLEVVGLGTEAHMLAVIMPMHEHEPPSKHKFWPVDH